MHPFSATTLANDILSAAVHEGASDIHFEPAIDHYRVRLRVDGLLQPYQELDSEQAIRLLTRLKVTANLDIAEKRLPQDGRANLTIDNKIIDFRISTCPTLHGEKIVIRIFKDTASLSTLEDLGLLPDQLISLQKALSEPQGLIVVTGPTGSGKTSTLYAALQALNTQKRCILTAEDPIEMELPGINQVAVQPHIGLHFSKLLKYFLRQDPDVLMIGEIRDQETAQMVVHAAHTGHLVLTTLHANNAFECITRLCHMGIGIYDLLSCARLFIAQRLVRKSSRGRTGIFECLSPTILPMHTTHIETLQKAYYENIANEQHCDLKKALQAKINLGLTTSEEGLRVLGHVF